MKLTTKNTAVANLSPDELQALQADREKMGGRFPSIPQIRLTNTDMQQAPEGEYFIERKNGESVDIKPIGKNPVITILYKTNTYSYFTKEDGLIAWTSDIHGFSELDDVTLFKRKGDKVEIDFEGSYPNFKSFADKSYSVFDPVTDKKKKLLKFKTVLYVSYEGEVYKMFVSNASSAGVDAKGLPAFENPQENSLQVFTDSCWKQKRVSYEFTVMLGSFFVKSSKPYYIMTFTPMGEQDVDSLKRSIQLSRQTQKSIIMLDEARKGFNKKEKVEVDPLEVFSDDVPSDPSRDL